MKSFFLLDLFRFAGCFKVFPEDLLLPNSIAISEKINVKFKQKKNHTKAMIRVNLFKKLYRTSH